MSRKQTSAAVRKNEIEAAKAIAFEGRCLELRRLGATYQLIADTVTREGTPITADQAKNAIRRGLSRSVPEAAQMRAEEFAKLDATEMRLMLKLREPLGFSEQMALEDRINRVRIHRARIGGLFTLKVQIEDYSVDSLNRELSAMLQGAAIAKDMQDADD